MVLQQLKHWTKLKLDSTYRDSYLTQREFERLKQSPRYIDLKTNLMGAELALVDGASFCASYIEIFEQEIYAFKNLKPDPLIIDGGANVGLSILYFKKLYPHSKIIAFEADPRIFEILKSNILSFGYSDVNLINKALWPSETVLEFAAEGADGGRVSRGEGEQIQEKIKVPTTRLHDYLDQPVDLLKLDIEGAEVDVLMDCSGLLSNVDKLFVEYHSFMNEEQQLHELINTLKQSGFRVQIQTQFASPQPLLSQSTQLGMDLQLNIFGYRG